MSGVVVLIFLLFYLLVLIFPQIYILLKLNNQELYHRNFKKKKFIGRPIGPALLLTADEKLPLIPPWTSRVISDKEQKPMSEGRCQIILVTTAK